VPNLAFCPCAPVLVPQVAQGAATETAAVLAACDAAVAALVVSTADGAVLVVGPGPVEASHDGTCGGTLAGFGVDLTVGGGGPADLPLSLTVGAWLLDRAGVPQGRRGYLVTAQDGSPLGAEATARLAGADTVLVMGDGTACLSDRAPGSLDPGAAAFDATVVAALGSGDPATLAGLDPVEGARLLAAGVPAWRAVGTVLRDATGGERRWDAKVTAHEAPYGVSYLVATWA